MKTLITILVVISLTSCASVGRRINQDNLNQIEQGTTTRDDVIRLLGSPDQITRDTLGNVTFTYTYMRFQSRPESFIPIIGGFIGGMDTQNQTAVITTDKDGIVQSIASSYGSTGTGTGLSTGRRASLQDVEHNKRPQ